MENTDKRTKRGNIWLERRQDLRQRFWKAARPVRGTEGKLRKSSLPEMKTGYFALH